MIHYYHEPNDDYNNENKYSYEDVADKDGLKNFKEICNEQTPRDGAKGNRVENIPWFHTNEPTDNRAHQTTGTLKRYHDKQDNANESKGFNPIVLG